MKNSKTSSTILLVLTSLFLSGCTHYVWMKASGDPATFPADSFTCKQTAMNTAPPIFQTYGGTGYGPDRITTRCIERHDREVCRTKIYEDPYYAPPQTVDLNASTRADLYNSCMNAHGWSLQPVEDPR